MSNLGKKVREQLTRDLDQLRKQFSNDDDGGLNIDAFFNILGKRKEQPNTQQNNNQPDNDMKQEKSLFEDMFGKDFMSKFKGESASLTDVLNEMLSAIGDSLEFAENQDGEEASDNAVVLLSEVLGDLPFPFIANVAEDLPENIRSLFSSLGLTEGDSVTILNELSNLKGTVVVANKRGKVISCLEPSYFTVDLNTFK